MNAVERDVEVAGALGLHARPAANFAETAERFVSEVTVVKGARTADAKSVLLVLALDVRQGDVITLHADGADAVQAVDELSRLVGAS